MARKHITDAQCVACAKAYTEANDQNIQPIKASHGYAGLIRAIAQMPANPTTYERLIALTGQPPKVA